MPTPRPFRPRDLLKQVMIQDVALAEDGSSVVYSRRTIEDGRYVRRLWRVPYVGGGRERLTSARALDGAPRFSPDGATLLFLSDRSGTSQPWLLPLAGGEPRRAATIDGKVSAARWAPDGKRIALVAPSGEERFVVGRRDDPVARRVTDLTWRLDGTGIRDQFNSAWIVGSTGGRPKRVTAPDFEVSGVFWPRDPSRLGFLADLRPEAAVLEEPRAWSVGLGGGAPGEICSLAGTILAVERSGAGILAVVGVDRPWGPEWATVGLFVLAEEGDGLRRLGAGLDRSVVNSTFGDLIDPDSFVSLCWSDADHVVALVGREGTTVPYRFGLDGSVERLLEGDIVCSAVAAAGDRVVVVATDRGRPGEVYALEGGALRPLTVGGSRWLAPSRRDPERHRISHPEGHPIDAWLVPARGRRRERPLVVQVHGGPHGSHGPTPWLEMLALADAGVHVLYPNPRGSVGYGEDFARSLHGRWGDPDGSDIVALLEWAHAEGLADPERLGVLGLSYGGFMVNWLLGHLPGRFAAAVSENPVTDMVGEFGSSDMGVAVDEVAVGAGALPDDLDEFLRRSPYVDIVKSDAPLLLLQCDDDLRCPPGQSELVFALLKQRGATVEMVRYPREAHYLVGDGRPDRRVDRIERIVDWFERYLAPRGRRSRS